MVVAFLFQFFPNSFAWFSITSGACCYGSNIYKKRKLKTKGQRFFGNFNNYYYSRITIPRRLKKFFRVLTHVRISWKKNYGNCPCSSWDRQQHQESRKKCSVSPAPLRPFGEPPSRFSQKKVSFDIFTFTDIASKFVNKMFF